MCMERLLSLITWQANAFPLVRLGTGREGDAGGDRCDGGHAGVGSASGLCFSQGLIEGSTLLLA